MNRIVSALFGAALLCVPAFGHGGGGGGGRHGGGHSHSGTYTSIYIARGVPSLSPAQIASYARIHNVGILSAIGGKLYLFKHNGFFNNDTDTRDITGWKLDEVMVARLRALLSSRFNLVEIPADYATVAAAIDPGLFVNNKDPLRDYLRKLNRTDLDAYLVVRPVSAPPGLYANLSWPTLPQLAANYEIDLIDAKTFEVIASAGSRLRFRAGEPENFPVALMPGRFPVGGKLSIPDDGMQRLRNGFTSLLKLTALETVRALAFGITLPRPGDRVLVPLAPGKLPLPNIRTVAVISDLGDQMTLTYRELWWQHGTIAVPTPGWTLDRQVEAALASSLDKRFTVKPISVDRLKLTNLDALSRGANVKAEGLPSTGDVDAYILVLKRQNFAGNQDAVSGLRPDDASGVGLWHLALDEYETGVFANYSIVVIDAHTLMPLATELGAPSAQSSDAQPQAAITNDVWPDKAGLTPAHDTAVRQAISDLMAESIPETLLRMGLTGMVEIAPPPTAPTALPGPASAVVTTGAEPDLKPIGN